LRVSCKDFREAELIFPFNAAAAHPARFPSKQPGRDGNHDRGGSAFMSPPKPNAKLI
jgi:hypothetical protein